MSEDSKPITGRFAPRVEAAIFSGAINTPIKNGFKLEDWFDIENYSRELTLLDWSFEVWIRSFYYRQDDFIMDAKTGSRNYYFSNQSSIRDYFMGVFNGAQKNVWSTTKTNTKPIHVLGLDDVINEGAKLGLGADLDTQEKAWANWFDNAKPISVNIEHTDDYLMKGFQNYLKNRRKEESDFALFAQNIHKHIPKWEKNRLLALFDLLYWQKCFETELTHTKIGAILWPDAEIEIEQRVRKTGRALISRVFKSRVAKVLYLEHLKTV